MTDENKNYRREFSAGGVVYKKDNNRIFIILIMAKGRNFGPPTGVWSFPKGHMEEGETVEQAALREVSEEAGVKCQIVEKLGSVKYVFTWGEDKVFKVASFFLMEYISGDPANHDEEVAEAIWIEIGDVEKKLTYASDKEIFAKAKEFLVFKK